MLIDKEESESMEIAKETAFELHTVAKEDITGLILLSKSVGWDYDEAEVNTLLCSGSIFGHKNREGEIISSAAVMPYGESLASIGMVIVNEAYRGFGLAKALMKKCMDSVSPKSAVMLVATVEGKPLYEKLGFRTVSCVHKFLCDNFIEQPEEKNPGISIGKGLEEDWPKLISMDKEAVGANRETFLINRIKQAKECLVARDVDGQIIGFGLSIEGPVNLILGPIAARNDEIGECLIDALAAGHNGKLRIDVPDHKDNFLNLLEKRGFIKVTQPPVMLWNAEQLPERNGTLYGIASQALG